VSIRVEALGVSITIADGSIAIAQTKTEIPAGTAPTMGDPAVASRQALPNSQEIPVQPSPLETPHRTSPPGSNGPTELPADGDSGTAVPASGKGFAYSGDSQYAQWAPALTGSPRDSGTAVPASQTNPLWNDDVEGLTTLPSQQALSGQTKLPWSD